MRIRAVDESASQEGTGDIARRAADEDVGNVADVLFHIHSQVLERGAKNRDAHPLEKQEASTSYDEGVTWLQATTILRTGPPP